MLSNHCDRCGQRVYFRNDICVACDTRLLFDPSCWSMVSVDPGERPAMWVRSRDGAQIKACDMVQEGVCNWACTALTDALCCACTTTRTRPSFSDARVKQQWRSAELAKRRLLVNLRGRGLPVWSSDGITPMQFDMLSPSQQIEPVVTGHWAGLITLNLDEADPVHRVAVQQQFAEGYRTLLGHLRHESGHFYWDALVAPSPDLLDGFRRCFGDERIDYAQALQAYHDQWADSATVPPFETHITAYATSHPWEDWAETWSHYFMLLDAMEVLAPGVVADCLVGRVSFTSLLQGWQDAALRLNDVNRALGLADPYPFALTDTIQLKLSWVHGLVGQVAVSR